jgi:tRNA (cytidine/uridine-2'-O-)-methyltransferase
LSEHLLTLWLMEKFSPKFKIVLYAPEIPGNTGSIGRTCVALNIQLILIKPYGFDIDEKAVRRAGLDYWKFLDLVEYENWDDFLKSELPLNEQLFFFENKMPKTFYEAGYIEDSYLIFGSETKGIPQEVLERYPERCFELPMFSDKIRSLNLSNTATTAAYECLRHLNYS